MANNNSVLAILLMIWLIEKGLAVHHKPQSFGVWTSKYRQELPTSTDSDGIVDYDKVSLEEDYPYPFILYCLHDDHRLCIFYDKYGRLVGVQISYATCELQPDMDPKTYSYSNQHFIKNYINDREVMSVRIYIVNPEVGHNSSTTKVEGLWTLLDGEVVKYDSKCQPNSPVLGKFNLVGCIPKIGNIYVFRFDEHQSCRNAHFLYLLFEKGKLVGFGHGMPGIFSSGPMNVYNYPDERKLSPVIPYLPQCFHDLIPYGFTTVIIWLIEDPWNIQCPKCLCD